MDMADLVQLLAAPFAACLVIAGLHCYMGIHVVRRGVIFVDLALAQVAALGATVGLVLGYELESMESLLLSILFTILGAALFTFTRNWDHKVPQEAVIGIVYAVSTAMAILILDRAVHGLEELKAMLVGSILFVSWSEVLKTALLYVALAAIHLTFYKKFEMISFDLERARDEGVSVHFWDFFFYVTFGLMVVQSVKMAGIILVFSFLIIPVVSALLFADSFKSVLILGWVIGFFGSALGLIASARLDLPTGAAVVTCFGLILVALVPVQRIVNSRR
jgi:zinc/manganese transport system permease protein